MNKPIKILLCILAIIIGWVLDGLAWSSNTKAPYNSIFILVGVGLIIGSIVYLIVLCHKEPSYDYVLDKNGKRYDEPRTLKEWLDNFNLVIVDPTKSDIKDLGLTLNPNEFWNWNKGNKGKLRKKIIIERLPDRQ